jgi:hypothetical protein
MSFPNEPLIYYVSKKMGGVIKMSIFADVLRWLGGLKKAQNMLT